MCDCLYECRCALRIGTQCYSTRVQLRVHIEIIIISFCKLVAILNLCKLYKVQHIKKSFLQPYTSHVTFRNTNIVIVLVDDKIGIMKYFVFDLRLTLTFTFKSGQPHLRNCICPYGICVFDTL